MSDATTTDLATQAAPKAQIADMITAIVAISERAALGEEVWEESAALGRQTKTYGDASWLGLGELARTVTTRYGDGTFSKWCEAVKLENITTGRQYRRVVTTIGLTRCVQYLAKDISFSFMRTAAYRFKGDSDLTVGFFEAFINRDSDTPAPQLPPSKSGKTKIKPIYEAQDVRFISYDPHTGMAQIFMGCDAENLAFLDPRQELHMIIKEVRE